MNRSALAHQAAEAAGYYRYAVERAGCEPDGLPALLQDALTEVGLVESPDAIAGALTAMHVMFHTVGTAVTDVGTKGPDDNYKVAFDIVASVIGHQALAMAALLGLEVP